MWDRAIHPGVTGLVEIISLGFGFTVHASDFEVFCNASCGCQGGPKTYGTFYYIGLIAQDVSIHVYTRRM